MDGDAEKAGGIAFPGDLRVEDFGDEGALAFRLSERVPRLLNGTAAFVLEALRAGLSADEAAARMAERFSAPPEEAREDVRALISHLASEGLLGLETPPASTPPLPRDWNADLEVNMAEPEPRPAPEETPPPEIPDAAAIRRTGADVILREEEEGAFLFEPETGELSCLNPVGIRVWRLVDEGRNLGDIVDALTAEYDGPPREEIDRDVRDFLGRLRAFGYVEWEEGG